MIPLRDALVHAMDATSSSVDEVTEALVLLLVAHVVSEGLDADAVARWFTGKVRDHRFGSDSFAHVDLDGR